jgi:hypothetical protein
MTIFFVPDATGKSLEEYNEEGEFNTEPEEEFEKGQVVG